MKVTNLSISTAVICVLFLAGCARTSPPTTLYTLGADPVVSETGIESDISIGLNRVVLADYLKRSNLLVRETDYKLSISNTNRWAGSLEDELNTAIAINLGQVVKTKKVFIEPVPPGMDLTYYVSVRILTFDGSKDGIATLRAWWGVYDSSRQLVAHDVFSAHEQGDLGPDVHERIVAAQSRLVERLCNEIGARLK